MKRENHALTTAPAPEYFIQLALLDSSHLITTRELPDVTRCIAGSIISSGLYRTLDFCTLSDGFRLSNFVVVLVRVAEAQSGC